MTSGRPAMLHLPAEFDAETGLYDFHAGMYDTTTGMFYALDPVKQTISPYGYALNSPVKYTHLAGMMSPEEAAAWEAHNAMLNSSHMELQLKSASAGGMTLAQAAFRYNNSWYDRGEYVDLINLILERSLKAQGLRGIDLKLWETKNSVHHFFASAFAGYNGRSDAVLIFGTVHEVTGGFDRADFMANSVGAIFGEYTRQEQSFPGIVGVTPSRFISAFGEW